MKEDLLFGRIALLNNIINQEQLDEALSIQKKSKPMRSVSYILRQKGQIKRSQVKAILQAQKKNLPRPVKSPEERKEDMAFGYIAFRHEYLTIDDLVKCLKLQGDVAKRGLLFRLSEILYNDAYLTYEQIEEVVKLQQDKILPCSKCQTPYNIVGLPAKARFPCRKCQNIIEVPETLASEDESELLEKYKSDIEEGILRIQQMPVVQAVVEDEEDEEQGTEQEVAEESSADASSQDVASESTSKTSEVTEDETEVSEDDATSQDSEDKDEFSETQPEDDEAENEFSETQPQDESEDSEAQSEDDEAEDEFSKTQPEDDETKDSEAQSEDDEAADEFSETQPEDDETEDEFSQEIFERKRNTDQSEESIEEEVFAEVESTSSSEIKHAWPREISLDTDEMYAQEMPDLEDVTAKATEKMKNDYNNQLKRKAEFSITTSDLSFFPEDTNTADLEIGALQSLTSFSDDEFSVMEDDFFEQTVYKKDNEEFSRIDTSDLNNNRFSFTSKLKVETKNEDDVVSLSSPKRKAKKKTQKKDRRTQMLRMNLELSDEDPDELFEDDVISIGPDALKKHRKKRKQEMRQLLLLLSVISMTVADIEISPASWDLKTIAHDSVHVKKFTLLNKSQEKVALAQKATGCNCIRYQLNKKTLSTNEAAEVIVTVAPRGQTGDFTWQVPIKINSDCEIAISVRAKIRKKYLFYPTQINFGTAKKGKGLSASLLVMSSTQTDFIIENIDSSHKSLTTVYEKKIIEDFYPGTQTGYEVTVQLQDDIDFGRHSEYLTIHTSMAENKTFKVPVFVYITGDITAVPDYVGVGVLSQEQVATKRVTLYHNNFEKFQILDIEIPDSFVKVRTEKVIDEKYYYLYIEINAKVAPRGEFRDIIKVRTDCITQEYIPIYVHGFIK